MAFFWVNLGDSRKEVLESKFLWAPSHTVSKAGSKIVNAGWKHLKEVREHDVIFCHEDGRIIYLAIALEDAVAAERPDNRSFDKWKEEGFRIEVILEVLESPVLTDTVSSDLIKIYNARTDPKLFYRNGKVSQQYMVSIPDGAGALLLDAVGMESIVAQDRIHHDTPARSGSTRESVVSARIG